RRISRPPMNPEPPVTKALAIETAAYPRSESDNSRDHGGTNNRSAARAARRAGRLPLPRRQAAGSVRGEGEVAQEEGGIALLESLDARRPRPAGRDRAHRVHRHRDRGGGAARRAELH